ncbi:MAG: 50S ribosomal protein L18e [Candidatus Thorarchaeota archaeon]|nr:MAG: 50S ribosomal protein L18e [Candidatus Thorarchaeota archaeon]
MVSGPTDPNTRALMNALRKTSIKHDVGIWKRVAELIARPARKRPTVNVGKIGRHTNSGDIVVIPGKVLGSGNLPHNVTVAAMNASTSARSVIVNAGGSLITIQELLDKVPKGTGVTILI